MNLAKYRTLVFDCDGVVLNSNKVKTEAFFNVALPYGKAKAQKLVDYHVARGGISRYTKFEWFLGQLTSGQARPKLEELLIAYAAEVRHGLLNCEIAEGLAELREKTKESNWLIVSGGDQQEIREIFTQRDLADLFDGGIFGSPDSKESIITRELNRGNIKFPALFLGDSRYDHIVAVGNHMDFLFLSGWSEFFQWPEYCLVNDIECIEFIEYLL